MSIEEVTYSRASNLTRRIVGRLVPRRISDPLSIAVEPVDTAISRARGLPPRRLRLSISPDWFDFKASGQDQVEFFVELAALRPNERVLDIACGVGRVALPLSRFLNSQGSYEGFDVNSESIQWCAENIGSRFNNFRFRSVDVLTSQSLSGSVLPEEFRFPYDDGSFDLAYAGSIFTHLTKPSALNYMRESHRVLGIGGRIVSTWNVYNGSLSSCLPEALKTSFGHWSHDFGDYRVTDERDPESNVAYDVATVRQIHDAAGMRIIEPFRVDASYCPARKPRSDRSIGMHLYHTVSVISYKG